MTSLFGALDTAVSGLTAQTAAFSNISDNVANSQTTGFKGTETDFSDYLTTSTTATNDSGFVSARPGYNNNVQGTISASTNPLALAVSGNGFFQVSQVTNNSTGNPVLSTTPEYTRDGNFTLDSNGYLVNDAGEALNGWSAVPGKLGTPPTIDQSVSRPIQVNQSALPPAATSTVTLAANLPATPATSPVVSTVNVYDANGTLHSLSLSWTQNAADDWSVAVSSPDATTQAIGGADVKFNDASDATIPSGTIASISGDTGGVTSTTSGTGTPATLTVGVNFGEGLQSIAVGLGNFGQSNGLTQFAGTAYTVTGISQNGTSPGTFSGVTVQSSGDVVANYSNGQTSLLAQVPLVDFAAPDALQRQNGQAFTATASSGAPLTNTAGLGGAGSLVTSSLEGSNVDIATEFTKLIVAQQAYSANTKIVTTANDMLQRTIDMKQ